MPKVEKQTVAHCSNPKCNKPIFSDHPYAWCIECGEHLSGDVKNLLPKFRVTAEAASSDTASANLPIPHLKTGSSSDNIGYLLGWFCWIPPVALIAGVVFLYKRKWRKAFQAIAITICYLVCINIVQIMFGRTDPQTSIVLNILTVIAVPIITVELLKSIGWPSSQVSYEYGGVRPDESANDSNDIVCPKCRFEQWSGYEKCQKCGVTFQKN